MADLDNLVPNPADQTAACIIHRPPFQLRSLPVRYRWEVTRRHPYYQLSWQLAQAHHRQDECQDELDSLLRLAAVAHLGAIGATGFPPDPAIDFEELEEGQLNAAWASGACHPISLRGMAGILLAWLPKETLSGLGAILTRASRHDHDDEPPHRIESLIDLQTLDAPSLDLYPDEPLVSINPAASGRQIEEAALTLLKEWKSERGLSERRDRANKYDEYLRVWDLREGWLGGTYDRTQEQQLRDVAGELGLSISTAHNQYCSAFALIAGLSYSPELWYRIFGTLKLSRLTEEYVGTVSRRRPSKSRTRNPIPESIVSPKSEDEDGGALGLASGKVAADDHDFLTLVEDIRRLIGKKLTDRRIAEELDLSPATIDCIAEIRKRGDDVL